MTIGLSLGIAGSAKVAAAAAGTRTAKTLVPIGDVQIDTANSKFGGASALYDGTGDGIEVSDFNLGTEIGTGAFTWECFFYVSSNPNTASTTILNTRDGGYGAGEGFILFRGGDRKIQCSFNGGPNFAPANHSALALNTWHHLALGRAANGLDWALWINGTRTNTFTDTAPLGLATQNCFSIGYMKNVGLYFRPGHIDEVRCLNVDYYGVGNSSITVPTVAHTDTYDTTLLLAHMDGADGSTTFIDDATATAPAPRTAKTLTAVNDAQIDTSRSKFGTASALFDGTGDVLVANLDSANEIGSGAFTIECFFNAGATSSTASVGILGDASGGGFRFFLLFRNYDNKIQIYFYGQINIGVATPAVALNTWHHLVLARDGSGNWALWLNGVREQNGTGATIAMTRNELYMGALNAAGTANAFNAGGNGWIDEVRVMNIDYYGVGNTSITVPTAAHTNTRDTTLLLAHMDGTDGSTTFTDDNS
jgi:hypothetical protein